MGRTRGWRLLVLFAGLSVAGGVQAQAAPAAADAPCVGLVLGGGGARGAAHVGVLMARGA